MYSDATLHTSRCICLTSQPGSPRRCVPVVSSRERFNRYCMFTTLRSRSNIRAIKNNKPGDTNVITGCFTLCMSAGRSGYVLVAAAAGAVVVVLFYCSICRCSFHQLLLSSSPWFLCHSLQRQRSGGPRSVLLLEKLPIFNVLTLVVALRLRYAIPHVSSVVILGVTPSTSTPSCHPLSSGCALSIP